MVMLTLLPDYFLRPGGPGLKAEEPPLSETGVGLPLILPFLAGAGAGAGVGWVVLAGAVLLSASLKQGKPSQILG